MFWNALTWPPCSLIIMSLPAGRLLRGSAREVLLSSCRVNYQQRRLQDSGVASWHIHSGPVLSRLGPPPPGASEPELRPSHSHSHSSLLHTLELPHQRSHRQPPPSSFYFIFFLSGTHGRPIDFDPQISVSRDRSLSRPGEVTETPVYSLCVREREKDAKTGERVQGAISVE